MKTVWQLKLMRPRVLTPRVCPRPHPTADLVVGDPDT